jgi:predicted RNA-binding Zn-ribbon protein involved in translation (DUF1610 family)
VELLNQQLQEQLRQLVNGTPTKCNSADIQCPKCGKSCRTRSTYCTTGNHWVHYKCQKLTPVEIRQIEDTDDTESDYTCKICGTDPKLIADGTNSEETLAKSLLLEENETRADEAIQSEEQEQQQLVCPWPCMYNTLVLHLYIPYNEYGIDYHILCICRFQFVSLFYHI